jgi:hypothetical protein
MPAFRLIPTALSRQLLITLLGYRCLDGVWVGPGPQVSEEALDQMPERRWQAFLRRWLTSAAATN